MESTKRVAVSWFPRDYPSWLGGRLLEKLGRVQHLKRNPRAIGYLRELYRERFGGDPHELPAPELRRHDIRRADEIVLLWPDGNGYGWFPVEWKVWRWKRRAARIVVLNGRRRQFVLGPAAALAYWTRRNLERFWIGEMFFTAGLFAVAPFLAALDRLRGNR